MIFVDEDQKKQPTRIDMASVDSSRVGITSRDVQDFTVAIRSEDDK